jgi:ribosome-associated protein
MSSDAADMDPQAIVGEPTQVLRVTPRLAVPLCEIEMDAVRSQGAGGQNVNKTATAIHLRFDVRASSLPEDCKLRLLARRDQRLTREGAIVIKAQQHRSQEQNREAALERLRDLIEASTIVPRVRRPTRVSKAAKKRRVDEKTSRGRTKVLRKPVRDAD